MKFIKAVCFFIEIFALGMAILLPFANPLCFIYSFVIVIIYSLYGTKIQNWTASFMDNQQ